MAPTSADLLRERWSAHVRTDETGAPVLSALFVLGQGSGVSIVDLRAAGEATGALGYVPGSVFMSDERAMGELADDRPVVFVSGSGRMAAAAALKWTLGGRRHVAAMAGGLVAWRQMGLVTSRDPKGVRLEPYEVLSGKEGGSAGISRADVERHIGDPRHLRWIKLASMVNHGHSSCIDGRDERGVVGTPGGDAGEFLLALAALERGAGLTLDEDTVAAALAAHVDAFGGFYLHSDVDAFARLAEAIRADPRLESAVENLEALGDLTEFLRQPDETLRDALLEHLINPSHLGCGHLRLQLEHGTEYGIRRGLFESGIRAIFRRWWDGAPEVKPTLLGGSHDEEAVLNIRMDEDLWGLAPIPLVSPACGDRQMFVNHPDVTGYLRETVLRFHLRGLGGVDVPAEREGDLRTALGELGARQLAASVGHLAAGLPIYDVVFSRDGSFTVSDA